MNGNLCPYFLIFLAHSPGCMSTNECSATAHYSIEKKKKKTGPTTKRGTFGDAAYILYGAECIWLRGSVKFN